MRTIRITQALSIPESELEFTFIRSPGPGGQNVNKVATGVLLRFNATQCASLSEIVRQRLSVFYTLTNQGDVLIKATQFRTQERNKQDAINRLRELLKRAATIPKKRKKTKPTRASVERRLSSKKKHAKTKSLRRSDY